MQQELSPTPPSTPECAKLKAIQEQSQSIGEFLVWLENTKGVTLMVFNENGEISDPAYLPFQWTPEALLAEYFGIDLKKVEEERQALLAYIRRQQSLQDQEH